MKKSRCPPFRLRPICAALLLASAIQTAQANPTGGAVVGGQAGFSSSGNTLTVTNTPGTIIHWQDFSIGSGEITRFVQQSAASTVLNRVVTANPSNILGSLQSNGRVFLVNPNGILFGAGATIDVAGLVATTLNLSNEDFLAGRHRYTSPLPQAGEGAEVRVVNQGNITAQSGGQIYLIAPDVENTGVITAPNGEILLAAGHSVELVDTTNPNLRVNITAPAGDATNVGQLVAESGSLGLFGAIVRNTGTVNADSATLQGGRIVFKASQRSEVTGTVSADGVTGGTIEVLGNQVGIMDGATLSADGTQGGGTLLIGGDYQGKNPDVPNAQVTYVAPTATISADATDNGNGGKVIVWADDTTRAYGNISARGGANGGNGGFVEISGHRYLDFQGRVDTRAPRGVDGTLLLDPSNITIDNSSDVNVILNSGIFSSSPTVNAILTWSTINAQSGNITVQTDSAATSGTGDININASSVVTGPASLTLLANNNINIANGVNIGASGVDFNLVAGWNNTGWAVTPGTGNIIFGTGSGLSTSGSGNIWFNAGNNVSLSGALVEAGGNMTLNVGGSLTLTGMSSYAMLKSGGTQTVDFTGAGAHQLNLLGGTIANGAGAGVGASIESGGAQQISNSGGTLAISLTGGDVSATGLSNTEGSVLICSTCATQNSASIRSLSSQTINASTITLTGGSGGNGNSANINSTGASTITATGAVTLTGGTSGGTYVAGFGEWKGYVSNDASFDSDASLTLNAGSLVMQGGSATYGGAFIGGPIVNITTTAGMGMTGGTGSSGGALDPSNPFPAGYVLFNPVAIGNGTGTPTVTLNIGGNLTITGGAVGATGGSPVLIGGLSAANVVINGQGNFTFNSANQFAERIGSWNNSGGSILLRAGLGGTGTLNLGYGLIGTGSTGTVTLVADGTGAAITQNASGRIKAASLNASTVTPIGSINLAGSNLVGSLIASANNSVAYNSAMSFLAGSVTSTSGAASLTSSLGDISIGTLSAGTSTTVNAYGAIYETNGVGVTDITAKSVALTSQNGGTSSGLAISADVNLLAGGPPTISASAGGTYGGIRIQNTGSVEPTSVSLADTSTTPGYGWVEYMTGNNVNTSTSAYNLSSQRGGVSLYSSGTVTVANLATFLPGQSDPFYKFVDIWGNSGVTVSNPGGITADLFIGTPGAMSLGGSMSAGTIGIYAAGAITATGANITALTDLGIWSNSGITLNNSSLTASTGSAYLGSMGVIFNTATGGISYSGGGSLTFTNSSATASSGDIYAATDGDIRLNNGSYFDAYNDVHLLLAGSSSTLYLNDTAGMANKSYIIADPTTIYVDFLARSSGGVVIDGVETLSTSVGGSGFFSTNTSTPARQGSGLMVTYGFTSSTLTGLINEIVVVPPATTPGAGTEEKKKDAPVVEDTSSPATEDTSTASLPVCS